jgi:hypothetical protein
MADKSLSPPAEPIFCQLLGVRRKLKTELFWRTTANWEAVISKIYRRQDGNKFVAPTSDEFNSS